MNSIVLFSISLSLVASAVGLEKGFITLQVLQAPYPSSPANPWEESAVLRMQAGDEARLRYLGSVVARRSDVPAASGRQITQSPTYIVGAKIGTPPQAVTLALDTSSDVGWVPCSGHSAAAASFDHSKSATFKNVSCGAPQCKQVSNPRCEGNVCAFNLTSGGSSVAGTLSEDNITLSRDAVAGYTFGCIQKAAAEGAAPAQGLLGLGRGPLSFLSQTKDLYNSTFSYCLPNFKSSGFTGSLRLGPVAQPKNIKSTPLLINPRRPSLYYVNLIGILVGKNRVNISSAALAFNPANGVGTVIDSGTVFTRLVQPAYEAVRDEFRRRMGRATVSSLGGFDTCYQVAVTIPSITFVFEGMNVTLPQDNFLIHSSGGGTTTCLAMAATPALNVIASLQQQNHRVLFDLPNSRLGVSREPCT
ncbi:unnamed protein product [Cuscuta campestris]|uniref:Peptidase A1 domain-containing protein n=1 Tax=Cuscuta campestris TaxID=132261 RepID=A0A484KHH7_9ASTE|nr:unnamed protein product [Cuscuta campestris]